MSKRNLYLDCINNLQMKNLLNSSGWYAVYEKYAKPLLKKGDRLLLRYPESRGEGELSFWGDYIQEPAWVEQIKKIASDTNDNGVDLIIYTRPPQNHDWNTDEPAVINYKRITERFSLYLFPNVSFFLDAGIDWNIKVPWAASLIDFAEKCGIKIGMEPVQGSRSTWGLSRETLIATDLYQLQVSKSWSGWRPIGQNDKVVMMWHSRIPQTQGMSERDCILKALKEFVGDCEDKGFAWMIPGDLPTNYNFTLDDLARSPEDLDKIKVSAVGIVGAKSHKLS